MDSVCACAHEQDAKSSSPGERRAANAWLPENVAADTAHFQKHQRLSRPSEFQRVFKTRSRSSDNLFLVLASETGLPHSRLGLAVSKEKLRKAVSRNIVKRLVRESFRTNATILAGLDLVVLPQKKIDLSDRRALRDSLNLHWRKVAGCKNFS